MDRYVLLITGPPCSGKTTEALRRSAVDGGTVLDRDLIAQAVGSRRTHMHAPDITARAEREMRAALDRVAESRTGITYVVRSLPRPLDLEAEAERLRATDVLVLDPGMSECVRRAQLDDRPRGTIAAIRQWYDRHTAVPGDTTPSGGRPCMDCGQPAGSVRCQRCCERLRSSRKWRRVKLAVFADEVDCWICHEYVDQELPAEHPKSRTADHMWALRDGGPAYERSNLRLAHRDCNTGRTNASRSTSDLLIVDPYTV